MVCKKELEEILDGCVFISIATLVAISKIAVLIVRIWGGSANEHIFCGMSLHNIIEQFRILCIDVY